MNCPKCNQPAYPKGGFFCAPPVSVNQKIKLLFFWVTVKISFSLQYCPKCGYLAVRDIALA